MCRYCEVSKQVLMGKWGNAPRRWKRLEEAGYDWRIVEKIKDCMICPFCPTRVTRPSPPIDKAPK